MIIFENKFLLVVDKRPGFLSVLSRLGQKDPRPCEFLEWQLKLNTDLWSVHRLDLEVSGLLILAKDAKSHSLLSQAFETRSVLKTYEAWTEKGAFEIGKKETWESKLLRGKKRTYESPVGKNAVTVATLKKIESSYLKWELNPMTGRSHQLRYECFKRKIPILGDKLYGAKTSFEVSLAIGLRATALDFSLFPARETLGLPIRLEAASIDDWKNLPPLSK